MRRSRICAASAPTSRGIIRKLPCESAMASWIMFGFWRSSHLLAQPIPKEHGGRYAKLSSALTASSRMCSRIRAEWKSCMFGTQHAANRSFERPNLAHAWTRRERRVVVPKITGTAPVMRGVRPNLLWAFQNDSESRSPQSTAETCITRCPPLSMLGGLSPSRQKFIRNVCRKTRSLSLSDWRVCQGLLRMLVT